MDRKPTFPSLWDLDPRSHDEHDHAAIEQLFCDAFEYRFGLRATPARIRPYLLRYFRFRVIPPWMRRYVKEVLAGVSVADVGNAPLDPVIDLRPLIWRGAMVLYLVRESRRPHARDSHLEA